MSTYAHLQETKVNSKEIYSGQIIQVYVDTIALANGQ
ncbi:Uncharacterised protein [Oligella urethralis]|nr:Uncharacterised protein [Oligella urethralis]